MPSLHYGPSSRVAELNQRQPLELLTFSSAIFSDPEAEFTFIEFTFRSHYLLDSSPENLLVNDTQATRRDVF